MNMKSVLVTSSILVAALGCASDPGTSFEEELANELIAHGVSEDAAWDVAMSADPGAGVDDAIGASNAELVSPHGSIVAMYEADHPNWHAIDRVTLYSSGRFERGYNGDGGQWGRSGSRLSLYWSNWPVERLTLQANGTYKASNGFTLREFDCSSVVFGGAMQSANGVAGLINNYGYGNTAELQAECAATCSQCRIPQSTWQHMEIPFEISGGYSAWQVCICGS